MNPKSASVRKTSPSTSSEPASSLLDILIKAEQEIQQNEEANDPLDGIGDIGDAVMNQLAGKTLRDVLGEGIKEEPTEEAIKQNALKLFDEAMYSNPTQPPKRKYTRWKSKNEQTTSQAPNSFTAQFQTMAKQYVKKEVKTTYPRANFNVPCAEMFQNDINSEQKLKILHEKVEEERNQKIASQVAKDVERLLASANKVYGPKEWTTEDKEEFGKFCRNLRSNRGLSMEDRMGLKDFYAKAYKLDEQTATKTSLLFYKEFRKANGMPPGLISPLPAPVQKEGILPLKRKSNHKEEESVMYPKIEKISVKEEQVAESLFPPPNWNVPFTPFHPGMKYEKEKEFRVKLIHMFMEVFVKKRKKMGRPKMVWRPAVPVEGEEEEDKKEVETRCRQTDMEYLMGRFNEVMEEDKTWSPDDIQGLGKYYDIFKEKMTFTIIQTKEIGNFLRKTFGRLEKYELERENDTALQEKRKFWQEYKKNHVPVRKAPVSNGPLPNVRRMTPVRPYIRSGIDTTGETEEQKKARKAAYLREWRQRRAEKQSVELSTRLLDINTCALRAQGLHGLPE